jgi:hypothetical protein
MTALENNNSYVAGRFVAANYGQWNRLASSVPLNVTGAQTIVILNPRILLPDGRNFLPFNVNAPIVFGDETLTPTSVEYNSDNTRVTLGLTFGTQHTKNDPVFSATRGLQEAINDAAGIGGIVTVDGQWTQLGGTTLMITDAAVPGNVEIEDARTGLPPSAGFDLTTDGDSGPATLAAGTLNIPVYSDAASLELTTDGTSGAATLESGTLNVPEYQGALTLTTTGDSGDATLEGDTLNIPNYTSTPSKASVGFSIANGAAASPAAPFVLAPVSGTVSECYFTTLTSDGSTDLTFNLKLNGTSVLSGSAATVDAGSTAGTVSTFALTSGTIDVTQGDKWELDITSGASDWTGMVQCY